MCDVKRQPDIETARSSTVGTPSIDIERRNFLKRSTAAFALAGLGAVRATPSLAQVYPTQPIRVIVPYPADRLMRDLFPSGALTRSNPPLDRVHLVKR
jgi:hypothetical protein